MVVSAVVRGVALEGVASLAIDEVGSLPGLGQPLWVAGVGDFGIVGRLVAPIAIANQFIDRGLGDSG